MFQELTDICAAHVCFPAAFLRTHTIQHFFEVVQQDPNNTKKRKSVFVAYATINQDEESAQQHHIFFIEITEIPLKEVEKDSCAGCDNCTCAVPMRTVQTIIKFPANDLEKLLRRPSFQEFAHIYNCTAKEIIEHLTQLLS